MINFKISITEYFTNIGVSLYWSKTLTTIILLILILILCLISALLIKKVILKTINIVIEKSKGKWDDIFQQHKVFRKISQIAPALIIYYSISWALDGHPNWINFIQSLTYIYIVGIGILVFDSIFNAVNEIYNTYPYSKERPIKGFIQVGKIIIYSFGIILILGIILGKSPATLLTGLGAMAAVLMLVFKDSILGLVAGIQLITNKMVRIGDWISMPSHNADGTVFEITLNTVKVRNFDMTITTVPTYALVSSSFSNWRGMEESGGRRIKRSINIDMHSIHFCSEELLNKLENIIIISDYIKQKRQEIDKYNSSMNLSSTIMGNGRRLTNIGVFRKYIEEYLKRHTQINLNMTFLVRQLAANENGLPIEIYVFSKEKRWVYYEAIQADIFDHILAAIKLFELDIFQNITARNLTK